MKIIVNDNVLKMGNRWTKGKFDRVYFDLKDFGLKLEYYKTGNISGCFWKGDRYSNAEGRRLQGVKAYMDVPTGEIHVNNADRIDVGTEEIEKSLIEWLEQNGAVKV